MKLSIVLCALLATTEAAESQAYPDHLGELFTNKENLYSNNWEKYKKSRQLMVDCVIYESENWLGTGKCKYSWECRGARVCERGGWCSGYDGCEGTPLPDQAPGLAPDF